MIATTAVADAPLEMATLPLDDSEARRVLLSLLHKKTRSIPAELLASHVMQVTSGADWPVRRAAGDALLRRLGFATRDALRVERRPAGNAPFGAYRTRRTRAEARPYTTVLRSIDPLRGSCNCADYLRSSLGLCKHLIVVLDDLMRRPRVLARAAAAAPTTVPLEWDPVRPFTGKGDWLERVTLTVTGVSLRHVGRWFRRREGERFRLDPTDLADAKRRAAIVADLLRVADDPAIVALLDREQERAVQRSSMVPIAAQLPHHLRSLEQPLFPYQVTGVAKFLATGRLLLADDMGLGKTAQAIATCHVLWAHGAVKRGLIIAPAALKAQWLREWQSFSETPIEIVDGSPRERARFFAAHRTGFLIANYEQVLRDPNVIRDWRADIVVLDEAQRIKNWATKTATCVKQLVPRFRLVLTGTPMENRVDELASILDWVDDLALEPKWRLAPWHSVSADGRTEVIGARNLGTLRQRLEHCMLRRVRNQVLEQLPSRRDTVVPVELTVEQADEHDALKQPIMQLVTLAKKRPLTQAEFLHLMTLLNTQRIIGNGMAQLHFNQVWPSIRERQPEPTLVKSLCTPKLLELREVVAQLCVEQKRKVVVFSQWRRMLLLAHWVVSDLLRENGLRAAFFTGHEQAKRRTQNLVDLHDDPAFRVLFATDAGGVGLNLQRAASCCINLELPWNPAVLEQRIGRIHRLGQKQPVDVYNFVSEDCIEMRIATLVANKKALFKNLFDGTSDEVSFDSSPSFLATMEKILEPAAVVAPSAADDGASDIESTAEAEVDAMLAGADESSDAAELVESDGNDATHAATIAGPAMVDVLSALRVNRMQDGGVRIEAPPAVAGQLATLLESLAQQLRGVSAR